jgi:hypothetical protein
VEGVIGGLFMPTLTLTLGTLAVLGVSGEDLRASPLAGDVTSALEAMLASHGFDMAKRIWTVELATGGFVFAQ